MNLRKLDSKKKKKIFYDAARFFGFKSLLKVYDFRLENGKVFMLSMQLGVAVDEMPEKLKERLVFAGIKVGEVGRKFRFTLEGSFFLARKERKKVYVNEMAEKLFLYGRDVFSSSIIKDSGDIMENDTVFVCNVWGDILGIGKARYASEVIGKKGEKIAVENLVDRGEYLRKKKLYSAF
jgi:60S ribosome subunit biogenesis protein NIP7